MLSFWLRFDCQLQLLAFGLFGSRSFGGRRFARRAQTFEQELRAFVIGVLRHEFASKRLARTEAGKRSKWRLPWMWRASSESDSANKASTRRTISRCSSEGWKVKRKAFQGGFVDTC